MSQNSSPNNVPSAKQGTADSLAAPGRVGAGGTTLEQFQRWLETKAHAASARVDGSSAYPTASELGHLYVIAECRAATKLLMQFKLEQGA